MEWNSVSRSDEFYLGKRIKLSLALEKDFEDLKTKFADGYVLDIDSETHIWRAVLESDHERLELILKNLQTDIDPYISRINYLTPYHFWNIALNADVKKLKLLKKYGLDYAHVIHDFVYQEGILEMILSGETQMHALLREIVENDVKAKELLKETITPDSDIVENITADLIINTTDLEKLRALIDLGVKPDLLHPSDIIDVLCRSELQRISILLDYGMDLYKVSEYAYQWNNYLPPNFAPQNYAFLILDDADGEKAEFFLKNGLDFNDIGYNNVIFHDHISVIDHLRELDSTKYKTVGSHLDLSDVSVKALKRMIEFYDAEVLDFLIERGLDFSLLSQEELRHSMQCSDLGIYCERLAKSDVGFYESFSNVVGLCSNTEISGQDLCYNPQ